MPSKYRTSYTPDVATNSNEMADWKEEQRVASNAYNDAPGSKAYAEAKRRGTETQYIGWNQDDAQEKISQQYFNPGSADWGGYAGAVDDYKGIARDEMTKNDVQQGISRGILGSSLANAAGASSRGPQSVENAALANREAATRGEELGSLGLMMGAAMGKAPSAAAYKTGIGMNDALASHAANQGMSRSSAGLAGSQLGATSTGVAMGDIGAEGGFGRAKEIGDAIGLYGATAGQVRGRDLTRLGIGNQNAQFNAGLNDEWALGNAGLAATAGRLGVAQAGTDAMWFNESMAPEERQFQYDQEAQSWEAGAGLDKGAIDYERAKARNAEAREIFGGIGQAAMTAIGSMAGPVGSMAGGMAGSAINSATRKYY